MDPLTYYYEIRNHPNIFSLKVPKEFAQSLLNVAAMEEDQTVIMLCCLNGADVKKLTEPIIEPECRRYVDYMMSMRSFKDLPRNI